MSNNTGANSRVPKLGPRVLDPQNPSLVQPFKRLVEEGFILELVVKFTPSGFAAYGKPDARMIAVEGSGLVRGQEHPLGQLKAVADKGNLIPVKGKSKGNKQEAQPLPKKSLCKRDFEGTDAELLARARAVAGEVGGSTLVGRVRSAQLFDGKVTTSFESWWRDATPDARSAALFQKKQLDELDEADLARFNNMQCPFRGPAQFVVADEEPEQVVVEAKPIPKTNGKAKAPAAKK